MFGQLLTFTSKWEKSGISRRCLFIQLFNTYVCLFNSTTLTHVDDNLSDSLIVCNHTLIFQSHLKREITVSNHTTYKIMNNKNLKYMFYSKFRFLQNYCMYCTIIIIEVKVAYKP